MRVDGNRNSLSPESGRSVFNSANACWDNGTRCWTRDFIHSAGMRHGAVIALNWLCEVTELAAASRRNAGRVCWIEFDDMMGAGIHAIGEAARFLGIAWDAADNERLKESGVLFRYSKDETRAFGQDERRAELAEVSQRHGGEIAKGLAWIHRACRDHPELACAESFIQKMRAIA